MGGVEGGTPQLGVCSGRKALHSTLASWPTCMHGQISPKKPYKRNQQDTRQILGEGPTELAAGEATSKVSPLCLSLPQGAEHPEAGGSGKLCEWVLNFLSPSSLCGRRQQVPFLHRFLAKNKQTKAGTKQGPLQAAGN